MKNLGDGLILRHLEKSDRESLLEHVNNVYESSIIPSASILTNQLLDHYPGLSLEDNFVVVDTKQNNKIIAWLCLLRKTCVFNDVALPYGQMDMVGTQKEYRNRGLIRQLSKVLEQHAVEYNLPFLVVLGIPYYYKRLGYEYAIELEESIRIPPHRVPPLENKKEIFIIEKVNDVTSYQTYLKIRAKRNAHLDLYQQIQASSFQFYSGFHLEECDEVKYFYLVKKEDKIIGNFYLVIRFGYLRIRECYVEDMNAIPAILRFAKRMAQKYKLPLTINKPAQDALIPYLEEIAGTKLTDPYAWFVKIPSFKSFLEQISLVLEKRLHQSIYKKIDTRITISYYKAGIKLTFKKGKLISLTELSIADMQSSNQPIDLYIPPNNLIQLLMGYRTLDELDELDVSIAGKKKHLLEILFPKVKASLTPTI
ncbi:MAG: GNAT family N-acetyltransferase [Promethearchaeota archaeon]